MGTIRFELQKDKVNQNGESPIRLIYQMHGQRKYYSTGQSLPEDNWKVKEQIAAYKKKGSLTESDIKKVNNNLGDIRREIEKIETRFDANGLVYTVESVISELKDSSKPKTLKISQDNDIIFRLENYIVDHTYKHTHGTLNIYRALKNNLEGYQQRLGKRLTLQMMNYSFMEGFHSYLCSLTKTGKGSKINKPLNSFTIAKRITTLKSLLNYLKKQDLVFPDNYRRFTVKNDIQLEIISLTEQEFKTLWDLNLEDKPVWDKVRNVFLFSCLTGMRYSDIKQLSRDHINDGFIRITAKKTGDINEIPLTPEAQQILDKYANDANPLPVISNDKTNHYLKEICKFAQFDKKEAIVRRYAGQKKTAFIPRYELIGFHTGRKTYTSLSLAKGIPLEVVMSCTGHRDFKTVKRYANIANDRKKAAMVEAWGSIVSPKLKAV